MSNAISAKNKPVEIKLDDKTVKIRFTLNSFIELEEIYGSIEKAMDALQGDIVIDEKTGKPVMIPDPDDNTKKIEQRTVNFKHVRNMLWAGMLPDNPDITPTQAGNLLDFVNIKDAVQKVMEAFRNSIPEKVGEADLKN